MFGYNSGKTDFKLRRILKAISIAAYLTVLHIVAVMGVLRSSAAVHFAAKFGIELPSVRERIEAERAQHMMLDKQVPSGANLFFGDSNTVWLNTSEIAPHSVNLALSRQRSEPMLRHFIEYRSISRAAHVFLMIGTNDFLYGHEEGLRDRYSRLISKVPMGTPVFLSSIPPLQKIDTSKAMAEARSACEAHPNCTFVNLFEALAPNGQLLPDVLQSDGVHLSPGGYAIWTRLLRTALAKNQSHSIHL